VDRERRAKRLAASLQRRRSGKQADSAPAPAPILAGASAEDPGAASASASRDSVDDVGDGGINGSVTTAPSSALSAGAPHGEAGALGAETEAGAGALVVAQAPRRKAAAVDATFVKRMAFILRIVVPSVTSKEAMLLAIQSLMLISRSFISLRIARKGGDGLQAVMERSWKKFFLVLGDFFVSGVAASVVNSALKYLTNSITVAFRQRLTTYVHCRYLAGLKLA